MRCREEEKVIPLVRAPFNPVREELKPPSSRPGPARCVVTVLHGAAARGTAACTGGWGVCAVQFFPGQRHWWLRGVSGPLHEWVPPPCQAF